jgi:hypothetical protein
MNNANNSASLRIKLLASERQLERMRAALKSSLHNQDEGKYSDAIASALGMLLEEIRDLELDCIRMRDNLIAEQNKGRGNVRR